MFLKLLSDFILMFNIQTKAFNMRVFLDVLIGFNIQGELVIVILKKSFYMSCFVNQLFLGYT
jgi:hypothetical protein